MKTVEKYQELKEQHAAITIEINKRQGILIRVMEELEEEFKVSTLDEAKKLLNKIENENKKAQSEIDTLLIDFQERWGDKING
tara:strand:- start:19447 stop:19695 length:249 start_codon:yes stop_codon:yes gene_type:complete